MLLLILSQDTDSEPIKEILAKDNYNIVCDFVENYKKEKQCHIISALWCSFHMMLSKNMVPPAVCLNSGLLHILEK